MRLSLLRYFPQKNVTNPNHHYHRGQNYYKKTSLHKQFLEATNFVIITKTLCVQLEKARKRPQNYYKNYCFRELFCNNFGQDGTSQESVAMGHLQFVLRYASNLYCSTFGAPYALKKGKYCQYSSHLYRNMPPICIAISLPFVSQCFWENLGGCGHRDVSHFLFPFCVRISNPMQVICDWSY